MLSSVDYRASMEADQINLINRDSVSSVGSVISRSLPVVGANTRVFRQALSLDEVCNCTCLTHILYIAWHRFLGSTIQDSDQIFTTPRSWVVR